MTLPDHRKQASEALAAASRRTYEIVKTLDATYRKRHELSRLPSHTISSPPGTGSYFNGHTDAAMQAYGQQCREAALKDAAFICNGEQWRNEGKVSVAYIKAFNEGCTNCEEAIRRLK